MRSDQRDRLLSLRSLARAGGHLEAAAVRVIGLKDIEVAAGEHWPTMRDKVFTGSLHLIENMVDRGDVVIPCGEGFLIFFASADAEDIEIICEHISEALVSFYLGEDGLTALRASVQAQRVPLEDIHRSFGMTSAPAYPPAKDAPLLQPIEIVPVWSLRDQARAAELCAALTPGQHGAYVGYDPEFLLRGVHGGTIHLATDLAILERAILATKTDAPHRLPLGIQVHASTMQHRRTRETYLSCLPDAKITSRLAFITISEIALGTPMISIAEWVALLRPHFPHVTLDFHYTDHSVSAVCDTGAWSASTHLPILSAAQRNKFAASTLNHLQFWAQAIHGRGMRLIVHGFQEYAFAQQAATLGVDFGTGRVSPPAAPDWARAPAQDEPVLTA